MTASHRRLHADATALGGVSLRAEAAAVQDVDEGRRLITVLAVPYGIGGRTNLGHGIAVRAGAIRFREPHRRVIGVYGHTGLPGEPPPPWPSGAPVARMVEYEDRPDALMERFRVARTPLGDQLLAEAQDGVRSGASVELVDVQLDQWSGEIIAGLHEYTAFVPLGAYDDAQVTSVAASLHQTGAPFVPLSARPRYTRDIITVGGGQPVPPQQQAPQQQQQQAPLGWQQVPAPQQQQAPQQQAPQQQQQLQAQPAVLDYGAMAAFVAAQGLLQQAPQQQQAATPAGPQLQAAPGATPGVPFPAAAPGGLPGGAVPQTPQQQTGAGQRSAVRRMAELQAQIMRERGVSLSLQAALADITPASGGLDLFNAPAGAIGEELWSGETAYARRYTTLMRQLPLTSYEGTGWQWVTKPKVEAYDGNKAQIASNTVAVEPKGWEARRAAAGWDVDRKFKDFGDAAFWQGFYQAQTDSYKELTDDWAIEALVAAALDITTDANVPTEYQGVNVAQADVFRGVALGNAILEDTKNVKRSAEYVLMNTQDWLTLLNFTNIDLPAFLALLGVTPQNFMRTPDVPAGAIVMGVKPAMTFRELGNGAPIRVEALDVARAGVDSAVYGYVAYSLDRPGGVISVPLVAPSAP